MCESIWQLSLAFSQATLPVLFAQLAFAHRPKILTVEFTFEAVDIFYHIQAVCNIQMNSYFVKQRIPKSSLKQIQATNPAKGRFRKQRMAAGNAAHVSLNRKKQEKGGQIILFWKVAQSFPIVSIFGLKKCIIHLSNLSSLGGIHIIRLATKRNFTLLSFRLFEKCL